MSNNGTSNLQGVKNPKRKRFPHGNYSGYYGTRCGLSGAGSSIDLRDPRLDRLPPGWFEGKKCLDVGCNAGHLTLAIVRKFRPCRMVGLDIDDDLVQRARELLVTHVRARTDYVEREPRGRDETGSPVAGAANEVTNSTGPATVLKPRALQQKVDPREPTVSHSIPDRGLETPGSAGPDVVCNAGSNGSLETEEARNQHDEGREAEESNISAGTSSGCVRSGGQGNFDRGRARVGTVTGSRPTLLGQCEVSFRREDFANEAHNEHGYDVVSLFSVVKWIHLNGGDDAVRRVFRKAYALLNPGGRLILEPQAWKSYKRSARQHGTAEARAHASTIRLRPTDFPSLLTDEIGFRSWEDMGAPGEGVGAFADRSVYVFQK